MDENEALIAAIKAEQAAKGMTQEELARRADVSVTSMQRYLAGGRLIRSDLMWKLGEALGVPTSALWADAERRLRQAEERRNGVNPNASNPKGSADAPASGDAAGQMAEQLSALRSLVESLGGELHNKQRGRKRSPSTATGDVDEPPAPGRPHAI